MSKIQREMRLAAILVEEGYSFFDALMAAPDRPVPVAHEFDGKMPSAPLTAAQFAAPRSAIAETFH